MYKQSSHEIFRVLPALVGKYLNGKERMSAVELGEKFDVNGRTLNVSLQKLVQAGILYSQRGGSNPGYGFIRDPQKTSLYEVLQVVSVIEYPRCSAKEYTNGENCMVCEIITSAVDTIVINLKRVNCYDLYLSLKDKMKL